MIAEALEEFNDNTFHNYWEYLLITLEMPVETAKYEHQVNFQDKAYLILQDWGKQNGPNATVSKLMYLLRCHRSITNKIRASVLKEMNLS